jgi:hypothetical protein
VKPTEQAIRKELAIELQFCKGFGWCWVRLPDKDLEHKPNPRLSHWATKAEAIVALFNANPHLREENDAGHDTSAVEPD